jgi:DNA-binding NarL/FixJ family response regulator
MIRAVLADDHPVFRYGVAELLAASGEVDILASVDTGTAAVQAIAEHDPDIAILDIAMPEMNGVAVVRRLVEQGSRTRAIMLSVYESRIYVDQAIEAGALGYVFKRSAFQNIAQAVRVVSAGRSYIDPLLPPRSVSHARHEAGVVHDEGKVRLAERERDILRFVAFGFTSKEIAVSLNSTTKTIETQKARTCIRLGLSTRAQIVQFAILQGWLQGEIPLR